MEERLSGTSTSDTLGLFYTFLDSSSFTGGKAPVSLSCGWRHILSCILLFLIEKSFMKSVLCAVVSLLLLANSVTVAFSARGHQLSGTPMSNGKRGTMEPKDAYLLATTLF